MKSFTLASAAILVSSVKAFTPDVTNRTVTWGDCPPYLSSYGKVARCGSVSLPIDWQYPEKGDFSLGFGKYPARKPEERKGTIFWQPGGPGEPATQHIALIEPGLFYLGSDLLDHYDIIGIDIRGTGISTPINCDADIYNTRTPWPIDTPEKWRGLVEGNKAFRNSCLEKSGNFLIDYMDSVSIARDYEAVRLLLGGEPMNWLSMSYGTMLGSIYAENFPYNIRSMVLDGSIAQPTDKIEFFSASAVGNERTFEAALQWCPSHPDDPLCPKVDYANMPKSLTEMWTDLVAETEKEPLPCSDTKLCLYPNVTAFDLRNAAQQHLYVNSNWGLLASAIVNATEQQDVSSFYYQLANANNTDDMTSAQAYTNSYKFSNRAVICQDMGHDYNAVDLSILDVIGSTVSPLLRGMSPAFLFQLYCIGWPGNDRDPPHKVNIPRTERLPKILMSQVVHDPATALSVGQKLRENIGTDRVVSIFRNSGGHGCIQQTDAPTSGCVGAIESYVYNLTLPEDGAVFSS